ncbi:MULTISPECIES: RadC family protein [Dictyoglomus]|jgi:DNA repair protein RadC|uniref:DNA repair protein RadC n=1 Tax=Dictyoglomus turgidum (strain DSM 6724 / Z-1310) TaxID=515635 RepID=B8E079_DICTD|nr:MULTISPECIES: DNA repair protein RadC [Dictyoglomus]ACK42162.1 DNA repair protein RadC [Dictyoglomus turgidum DSM 6724]PNV78996.1 MAG: JAB domain-containing protein [Dictyoglomus turgidum]HBU32392.1 JAB domain-containing protein [Dictyoglomus sp.]
MKKRKIKDFPKSERPRERLLNYGEKALSDAELLAIILRTGNKNYSVYELAQNLIVDFGSLKRIAEVGIGELIKYPGIGITKAVQIKASIELGRRIFSEKKNYFGESILNPHDAFLIFKEDMFDLKEEHLFCIYMDVKNKCLNKRLIAKGDLNIVYASPREIFKYALQENSSKLILAHNHPSGDLTPSEDDIIFTKRLIEAGKILGLEILDHLIIYNEDYVSLKEKKLI